MAKRQREKKETPVLENEVIRKRNSFIAIVPPVDGMIGDHRFVSKIRYGRFSGEEFCKNPKRRQELGLPALIIEE